MSGRTTDAAELDRLLRACVECGLCLPHCATYLATGDEVHGPRGRLLLLADVLADRIPAEDASVQRAFATCLGCLACSKVCPSGVSPELLDRVTVLGRRPSILPRLLERPAFLRVLRTIGGAARPLLHAGLGAGWRRRLASWPRPLARPARWLGSMPTTPRADQDLIALLDRLAGLAPTCEDEPARRADGPTVAWFRGCADPALLPGTQRRLGALLRGLGCTLAVPAEQACCGAIAEHDGRPERADRLFAQNRTAFAGPDAAALPVLTTSAGCGRELRRRGGDLGDRAIDATAFIESLSPSGLGAVPLRVAIHDACHGRHGQGLIEEPRRLLRRIPGLQLLEPEEPDVCCGAAGTYAVVHPDLSASMGRRKADRLLATGCDLVVTTNAGCLGQIADAVALRGADVPILPLSDLVWYSWRRGAPGRASS